MRTLSVQQPWASLIVYGIKDVENRTWDTQIPIRRPMHRLANRQWKNKQKNNEWEQPSDSLYLEQAHLMRFYFRGIENSDN